jgi:hypothetical protein
VLALLYFGILGTTNETTRVTLFEAAMGPQIGGAIVAVQHGLNPPLVSLMVGLGISLSFLTLPLWSYALHHFQKANSEPHAPKGATDLLLNLIWNAPRLCCMIWVRTVLLAPMVEVGACSFLAAANASAVTLTFGDLRNALRKWRRHWDGDHSMKLKAVLLVRAANRRR